MVKLRPVGNVKGRPSFTLALLDYGADKDIKQVGKRHVIKSGADKNIKQAGNRRVIKSGRECQVLIALRVGLGYLGTRKFNPLARR